MADRVPLLILWSMMNFLDKIANPINGWLGSAQPFLFAPIYQPAAGITRMQSGTPPVLALSSLRGALKAFDGVHMGELWRESQLLSEQFLAGLARWFADGTLRLNSSAQPNLRGCHLALACVDENMAYAVMQNLIQLGVIGDFRPPDMMRFAFTPLYLNQADIARAVETLNDILTQKSWNRPEFHRKNQVV